MQLRASRWAAHLASRWRAICVYREDNFMALRNFLQGQSRVVCSVNVGHGRDFFAEVAECGDPNKALEYGGKGLVFSKGDSTAFATYQESIQQGAQ